MYDTVDAYGLRHGNVMADWVGEREICTWQLRVG